MTTTIRKWGNSLAVRIPRALAEEIHVTEESEVEVKVKAGALVIALLPRRQSGRYRLDQLLSGITPQNLHHEADLGAPVGREQL